MAVRNPLIWLAKYFSELPSGDQVQFSPGTSGAPGVTFRGANSSGFYQGTGIVGIAENGTDIAEFGHVAGLNALIALLVSGNVVIDSNRLIRLRNFAVSGLPASPPDGCIAFVTDSTQTLALGIGTPVVGGSTNQVPVYSSAGVWNIG